MKVGYVVKRYPRYSETFIVNEILAHEAAGMEVEIFSLLPPEDGHFQDSISRVRAPVTYLQAKGLKAADFWSTLDDAGEILPYLWDSLEEARGEDVRYAYQAVVLARETRRRDIDHLHAHFATASTTVARLAARFVRIPYTMTAHAKDIFHESVRPEDLRRKLQDAAATVTISDYNLDFLHDNYGPAAEGVRRIYNGLELERFPYKEPRGRVPEIVAVERLGLGNRVELPGPRPQGDLIKAVRRAAVFAAPCVVGGDGNRDGLPTVLLEAMALGTPCISTDVTGIPEVLRNGETGLMVPQRDPAALADAIERLLVDPELRVRLAGRARQLVEAEFDVRRNAALLREMFEAAHAVAAWRAS